MFTWFGTAYIGETQHITVEVKAENAAAAEKKVTNSLWYNGPDYEWRIKWESMRETQSPLD